MPSLLPFFLCVWLCSHVSDTFCREAVRRSSLSMGASTSAYQIEGAWNADGKGPSIWDDFTHQRGRIANNDTGDDACRAYDYGIYTQDLDALRGMHLTHYRFSISWSRILPLGTPSIASSSDAGDVTIINRAGIDYYHGLLDELEKRNITPVVTMFHFDLPSALQDRYGGLENPLIVGDFVAYADVLFAEFGTRVKEWITFNEPYTYVSLGYVEGTFAPGKTEDCTGLPYLVAHNMLEAHRLTYAMFHERYAFPGVRIGISLNSDYPLSDNPALVNAGLTYGLAWFLDPLVTGDYPPTMRERLGPRLPSFAKNATLPVGMGGKTIKLPSRPFDFIGINHYSVFAAEEPPPTAAMTPGCFRTDPGFVYGDPKIALRGYNKWLYYYPEGMSLLLEWMWRRYGDSCKNVLITENGWSMPEGDLDDDDRILYLKNYLMNVLTMRERLNITHYFIWSLIDNFEWNSGYREKYGLLSVDRATKERTWKQSAFWVRNLLAPESP